MSESPNMEEDASPVFLPSRKTLDKVRAFKQFYDQFYTELFRRRAAKRIADESRFSPADALEHWRAFYSKETTLLRSRRTGITLNDFEVVNKIGRGGFSEVFVVKHKKTKKVYALKCIDKSRVRDNGAAGRVRTERAILSGVTSRWCVKLYFAFQDHNHLYLVMEFVPGGDLGNLLTSVGCLEDRFARLYLAEMFCGVAELHMAGYIHRDLKPSNFLIDAAGMLKLSDFGLATGAARMEENLSRTKLAFSVVGTPDYMAPEVLEGSGYNYLCDFWSLGCILFEMLSGVPPFTAATAGEVFLKVALHKGLPTRTPGVFSDVAWDLLVRLLSPAETRIGRGGFSEIHDHAFFKGLDWDRLTSEEPPFKPSIVTTTDVTYFTQFRNLDTIMEGDSELSGFGDTPLESEGDGGGLASLKEHAADGDVALPSIHMQSPEDWHESVEREREEEEDEEDIVIGNDLDSSSLSAAADGTLLAGAEQDMHAFSAGEQAAVEWHRNDDAHARIDLKRYYESIMGTALDRPSTAEVNRSVTNTPLVDESPAVPLLALSRASNGTAFNQGGGLPSDRSDTSVATAVYRPSPIGKRRGSGGISSMHTRTLSDSMVLKTGYSADYTEVMARISEALSPDVGHLPAIGRAGPPRTRSAEAVKPRPLSGGILPRRASEHDLPGAAKGGALPAILSAQASDEDLINEFRLPAPSKQFLRARPQSQLGLENRHRSAAGRPRARVRSAPAPSARQSLVPRLQEIAMSPERAANVPPKPPRSTPRRRSARIGSAGEGSTASPASAVKVLSYDAEPASPASAHSNGPTPKGTPALAASIGRASKLHGLGLPAHGPEELPAWTPIQKAAEEGIEMEEEDESQGVLELPDLPPEGARPGSSGGGGGARARLNRAPATQSYSAVDSPTAQALEELRLSEDRDHDNPFLGFTFVNADDSLRRGFPAPPRASSASASPPRDFEAPISQPMTITRKARESIVAQQQRAGKQAPARAAKTSAAKAAASKEPKKSASAKKQTSAKKKAAARKANEPAKKKAAAAAAADRLPAIGSAGSRSGRRLPTPKRRTTPPAAPVLTPPRVKGKAITRSKRTRTPPARSKPKQ